jgi:hypothetical protein
MTPGRLTPGRVAHDPEPAISATLTPEGVTLADEAVVPGTAGRWPSTGDRSRRLEPEGCNYPITCISSRPMTSGISQVWQLPQSGEPARAVTAETPR